MGYKIIQALINLYVKLGGNAADVANVTTTPEMINAIAGIITNDKVVAAAESGNSTLFETNVNTLQTGVNVTKNAIIGTLKKQTSGQLVTDWGEGYFVALKFIINDPSINHNNITVGLEPSEGSGLVALDEDLNGVFKVTNKDTQNFKIVVTVDGQEISSKEYDLSNLTLAE